jgi:hypothetical protein
MAKRTSPAVLGALLAGFLLLISGSAPVSAHAGHNHGSTGVVSYHFATPINVAVENLATADHRTGGQALDGPGPTRIGQPVTDLMTTSGSTPQPLQLDNCCCGSFGCHAGVSAPLMNLSDQYRCGERVRLVPVLGAAKSVQIGIERPPRGPISV